MPGFILKVEEKWEAEKGYQINVEHLDPSKQALLDFRTSILDNKSPGSSIITGANVAICVQMGLDAMYNNEIVEWNDILSCNEKNNNKS